MLLLVARGVQDDPAIEIIMSEVKKHRVELVPVCRGIKLTFRICIIDELFIIFAEDQRSQLPI